MFRSNRWISLLLSLGMLVFCVPEVHWAQEPPGPIQLVVDESSAPQKIIHATLSIPAKPGPLTLVYPKWIPGEHAPDGPIEELSGLKFTAGGKTLKWRRDLLDMFAFHLDVPKDADAVQVQLDMLLSAPATGFSSGASATAELAVLSWNEVLLYPAGWPAQQLTFQPSLRLPQGWKFGTALPIAKQSGERIEFAPVSLNTLVDSPVLAGEHFRAIQLTPGEKPPHEIDIAADSEAALAMPPETETEYRQLVAESAALYGARHYRDYHFLLTLSDAVAHFGLEHHESSDDRVAERTLVDDTLRTQEADLLPHEFVHSWNGKYRRPADLATPDFQQPMKDDLLWVYEGLTQYLGEALTARSGLWSPEQYREHLAYIAATLDYRSGREWRSLQDTADAASLLYFAQPEWESWRRGTDFYDEGQLLWLDVDTTMRRLTNDRRSINDFCRAFFGGPGGQPELKTYTFDDLVAALNDLAPYDWRNFLTERLESTTPHAQLAGVEKSGWHLVYDERPNSALQTAGATKKILDFTFSLGFVLNEDGTIRDVVHGMVAYNAGLGPDMRINSVNGHPFSPEALRDALAAAKKKNTPVNLAVANGEHNKTYRLDYYGGMRYPHLVRDNSRPDLLSEILKPLATGVTTASVAP
jgi:predicted metalloprotease with PDZ domain